MRHLTRQAMAGLLVLAASALPAISQEKAAETAATQPATQPSDPKHDAMVGKPAPDFDLRGAVTGAKRLSDLRGQAVVMVFHGKFCPPSRKAVQCLAEVNQQSSVPFELIVANSWDTPDVSSAEMESLGISPAVVCDENLASLYEADAIPLVVFIGADGTVTRTFVGYEGASMAVKFSESAAEALNKKK